MKKIIIAVLLMAGAAFAQQEFQDEFSRPADNIEVILIDSPHGRIFCEPTTVNEISVVVKKIVYLKYEEDAKELAEACKINCEVSGKTYKIEVDLPRGSRYKRGLLRKLFSLEYDEDLEILVKVKTPSNIKIAIETSSADVFATDLQNDIEVNGSSADVTLENIKGNCAIDLSSGDLEAFNINGELSLFGSSSDFELDEITGAINISTSSGDGIIDDIKGAIKLKTSSGDIKMFNIDGDLDFRSTSGDLTAGNITGFVDIGSSSGTVNLRRLTNKFGRYYVETSSGDVHLEIDPGFDGTVEIETISGSIDTRLDITMDRHNDEYILGATGDGGGKIEIETSSGDITLECF